MLLTIERWAINNRKCTIDEHGKNSTMMVDRFNGYVIFCTINYAYRSIVVLVLLQDLLSYAIKLLEDLCPYVFVQCATIICVRIKYRVKVYEC